MRRSSGCLLRVVDVVPVEEKESPFVGLLRVERVSKRVESALRRVRKRDAAIARLVEEVHAQRMQLAQGPPVGTGFQ